MNEDAAPKLVGGEDGPAAPADPIASVRPLEGEFHGVATVPLTDPVVETDLNRQKAQSAAAVTLQGEMRRTEQVEAATILKVTQPRVSDLLRGRLDLFSTDSLIDMLARLGVHVRLVLKSSRRRQKVA
ncbi:MAG: XRE family transcriptional regulator [Acidobacteria bacterium]|nr:XRE family transcriptional regulator [Acidobacteriota bacterium]